MTKRSQVESHPCGGVLSLNKTAHPHTLLPVQPKKRETSGIVVECLTRYREAAGSSLTGVTT